METILEVLMRRDGMTREEAQELINEAKEDLQDRLAEGDEEGAHDICEDWFGLEPDYLMELL